MALEHNFSRTRAHCEYCNLVKPENSYLFNTYYIEYSGYFFKHGSQNKTCSSLLDLMKLDLKRLA